MIQACHFDTPIQGNYLRNNRSTKQKSLRCFPSCDPRGHISAGFCGVSLQVRIHLTHEQGRENDLHLDQYIFIAETRPTSHAGISSMDLVSKQYIMQNIRAKSEFPGAPKGELFIGDVTLVAAERKEAEIQVTFNAQHSSWDYSWKSNRWSGCHEQHIVDIIVLKFHTAQDYLVTSSYHSNSFIVASSHKRPTKSQSNGSTPSDPEVLQASNLLTTLCEGPLPLPPVPPPLPLPRTNRKTSLAAESNRDTEGAETLISLLGPIVSPRHYMYDMQTNKRSRVESDEEGSNGAALTSSATSDSDYPEQPILPAQHTNNLILLPTRHAKE